MKSDIISSLIMSTRRSARIQAANEASIKTRRKQQPGVRRSTRQRAAVDYSEMCDASEPEPAVVAPAEPVVAAPTNRRPIVSFRCRDTSRDETAKISAQEKRRAQHSTSQHTQSELLALAKPTTVSDFLLAPASIRAEMRLARAIIFEQIGLVNATDRAVLLCAAETPAMYDMVVAMTQGFPAMHQSRAVVPQEIYVLLMNNHTASREMVDYIVARASFIRFGWSLTEIICHPNFREYKVPRYNQLIKRAVMSAPVLDSIFCVAIDKLRAYYPDASLQYLIDKGTKTTANQMLLRETWSSDKIPIPRTVKRIVEAAALKPEEILNRHHEDYVMPDSMIDCLILSCGAPAATRDAMWLRKSEKFLTALIASKLRHIPFNLIKRGAISRTIWLRFYVAKASKINFRTFRQHIRGLQARNNQTRYSGFLTKRANFPIAEITGMPRTHFLALIGGLARAKVTDDELRERDSTGRSLYFAIAKSRSYDVADMVSFAIRRGVPIHDAEHKGEPAIVTLMRHGNGTMSYTHMWPMLAPMLGGCPSVYAISITSTSTVGSRIITRTERHVRKLLVEIFTPERAAAAREQEARQVSEQEVSEAEQEASEVSQGEQEADASEAEQEASRAAPRGE